jgi:REP element-mobilizing transposase RayT
MVVLPDHLHAIWTLPPGDRDFSRRWGWIKKEFTNAWLELGGLEIPVSLRSSAIEGTAFGRGDSGNTRFGMMSTSKGTVITSTITL